MRAVGASSGRLGTSWHFPLAFALPFPPNAVWFLAVVVCICNVDMLVGVRCNQHCRYRHRARVHPLEWTARRWKEEADGRWAPMVRVSSSSSGSWPFVCLFRLSPSCSLMWPLVDFSFNPSLNCKFKFKNMTRRPYKECYLGKYTYTQNKE